MRVGMEFIVLVLILKHHARFNFWDKSQNLSNLFLFYIRSRY